MRSAEIMREDYEAIPFGFGRIKYNWLLVTWIIVTWIGRRLGHPAWWNGGRRTDGEPCVCHECGWIGRVRDCATCYDDYGEGGCECPHCGKEV